MPHDQLRSLRARVLARLAGGEDGEAGVSLVEILVSVSILGVAMSGLASVLGASMISISREQSTVRGAQLANELVEEMRALDFDDVTFYADDGVPTYVNGHESVIDTDSYRPTASPAPLPGPEVVTHDGTTYTVTRSIVWIDDAADGVGVADQDTRTHDFKGMTVRLDWQDRGQSYDYTASTSWAPSTTDVPLHQAACQDFQLLDGVVTLTAEAEISPTGGLLDPLSVFAKTCGESATVVLTLGSLITIPLHAIADTNGQEWALTLDSLLGLPLGEVAATLVATAADGSVDTWTGTTTFIQPDILEPLDVMVPTVAPSLCVRTTTRAAWRASTVSVQVHGFPAPTSVTVAWSDANGSVGAIPTSLPLLGEGWTAVIPAGTVLNGSSTTLTITAQRLLDGATASESFVVPVTATSLALSCPA